MSTSPWTSRDQVHHLRAPRVHRLHCRDERPLRRLARAKRRGAESPETGCHPKQLIERLSEGLLAHFTGQPLIDPYDIYQHLMDYWAETMQDDAYLIAADGWKAETYRVIEKTRRARRRTRAGPATWCPRLYIVARYFARSRRPSISFEHRAGSHRARLAELEEEQGGEEGAFSGFDKVNVAAVKERIKDDAKAYARYPRLGEDEIKGLVVDDKWFAALDAAIHGELDRVSQTLTRRVKELAERYEAPLPRLTDRVAELEARVSRHLEKMGYAWK
jgi:type I restriction enzyme M protein